MLLESWVRVHGETTWKRKINYPIIPFPGLFVGSLIVRAVYCCQGDLDGVTPIEVELALTDQSEMKLKNIEMCLVAQGFEPLEG